MMPAAHVLVAAGTPVTGFLEATVRTATPLALAALGETVVESVGVINIGVEGAILAGAFGGLVGSSMGSAEAAYTTAVVAGLAIAALFALFAVTFRADQIITGTAVNLLAFGLTGTLYREMYGATGASLTLVTSSSLAIPGLARIPILGPAFFDQPWMTYLAYLLVPLLWYWIRRTHWGLAARSIGERPEVASLAGISTSRFRWIAILFGGALAGLSGGTLVLAQSGTFAEGMSAGRGFIAIAIVVLGRWQPVGVALGALLFGAASALQYAFQSFGWQLPYQLFLALPYIVTLLALAGVGGRARAPAALGRP